MSIESNRVRIDAVYLDVMHPSTCIVDRLVVDGTPPDPVAIAIGDLVVVVSALDTKESVAASRTEAIVESLARVPVYGEGVLTIH